MGLCNRVVISLSFIFGCSMASAQVISSFATKDDKFNYIFDDWSRMMSVATAAPVPLPELQIRANLEANNSYALYNFQLTTQALMIYLESVNLANNSNARKMVRDLANLYAIPFENAYLKSGPDANGIQTSGIWVCGDPQFVIPTNSLATPCPTPGVPKENLLYSVQFAYGVAKVIALIAKIPKDQRVGTEYAAANNLLMIHGPKIVAMYKRWLSGANSKIVLANIGLDETARTDINGVKYTLRNSPVTDQAMQLMGGILELQLAQSLINNATEFSYATDPVLEAYRLHFVRNILNDTNRMRTFSDGRMIFDPKWRGAFYKDGYVPCFWLQDPANMPSSITTCTDGETRELSSGGSGTVTYDISHYQRVVYLLDSIARFPTTYDKDLGALGRSYIRGHIKQFSTQVSDWNGQGVAPTNPIKLKNYFGSFTNGVAPNGWYRLQASGTGDGLMATSRTKEPFALTDLAGPYMLWVPYNLNFSILAKKYYSDESNRANLSPPTSNKSIRYAANEWAMVPVVPETGNMSITYSTTRPAACPTSGGAGGVVYETNVGFDYSQAKCDTRIRGRADDIQNGTIIITCCYNGSKYRSAPE